MKYKVRILANGPVVKSDTIEADKESLQTTGKTGKVVPSAPICHSYFANMVDMSGAHTTAEKISRVEATYRETLLYDILEMKVTCFIGVLADKLSELIPAFFLLHNFGTRQSKGFGSFTVHSIDGNAVDISPLVEITKRFPNPFYMITYPIKFQKKQTDDIADIYQLMKSGLNYVARQTQNDEYARAFIYSYMHDKNIGNEKAWMKQNEISPVVARKHNALKGEHKLQSHMREHRYVRAVLGISDHISYISGLDENDRPLKGPGSRTSVSIESEDKTIERFPSPVFFKVIEGKTFIIPYEPAPEIFNKPFKFASNGKSNTIYSPDSFSMQKFVAAFVSYINNGAITEEPLL